MSVASKDEQLVVVDGCSLGIPRTWLLAQNIVACLVISHLMLHWLYVVFLVANNL